MKKLTLVLSFAFCLTLTTIGYANITVENSTTGTAPIADDTMASPGALWTLDGNFAAGAGDLLVVGVAFEGGSTVNTSTLSFAGGPAILPTVSSIAVDGSDQTSIYVFQGVSGVTGALEFSNNDVINFPGYYAASLSGAAGVEASGSFAVAPGFVGDLTGTASGTTAGAYVLAAFTDQSGGTSNTNVSSDPSFISEVSVFGTNANGTDVIGSAIGSVATGFSPGGDLDITFTDGHNITGVNNFQTRSNFSFVSIEPAAVPEPSSLACLALGSIALITRRRRR